MSEEITIRNCSFASQCNLHWEQMSSTDLHDVRFCSACAREVHFCDSDESLARAVKANKCVAIQKDPETILLGEVDRELFAHRGG
jgi:hypothetical protein